MELIPDRHILCARESVGCHMRSNLVEKATIVGEDAIVSVGGVIIQQIEAVELT